MHVVKHLIDLAFVFHPTHPYVLLFLQTYFYQAVILLLDHGPDGSYGIILNRPTQYKVSQIKSTVHELLSLFSDNRLYMGGDCGDTAMVVLTHRNDIDGVTEVSHGKTAPQLEQGVQCWATACGTAVHGILVFSARCVL